MIPSGARFPSLVVSAAEPWLAVPGSVACILSIQPALCADAPVEAAVWAEVCRLLEDPRRMEQEYRRRWRAADSSHPPLAEQANAAHLGKLRQGLARLIDSYTDGLISKEEFAPRLEPPASADRAV
jgi:hypothetical protein